MRSFTLRSLWRSLPRFSRGLSLALGLVVFGLTIMAVLPQAHAKLHAGEDHPEHECVVDLYAQGVIFGGWPVEVGRPTLREAALGRWTPDWMLSRPRQWLPLGRGPPVV